MTELITFFALAALLAGLLAGVTIWAPRRIAVKVGAVALTFAFMPVAYGGFADLLSKPKPIELEWLRRSTGEVTVLSARLQPDKGIYLWLALPDVAEPRYYRMPWKAEVAQQLQQAMREAEEARGGLAMRMPFEGNWDKGEPLFHPLPQPKLPEKSDEPGRGPMVYKHPGMDA